MSAQQVYPTDWRLGTPERRGHYPGLRTRLAPLCRLLGSPDADVRAWAALRVSSLVGGAGCSWGELLDVEEPPAPLLPRGEDLSAMLSDPGGAAAIARMILAARAERLTAEDLATLHRALGGKALLTPTEVARLKALAGG
jgi:hypothetical protein